MSAVKENEKIIFKKKGDEYGVYVTAINLENKALFNFAERGDTKVLFVEGISTKKQWFAMPKEERKELRCQVEMSHPHFTHGSASSCARLDNNKKLSIRLRWLRNWEQFLWKSYVGTPPHGITYEVTKNYLDDVAMFVKRLHYYKSIEEYAAFGGATRSAQNQAR